MAYQKTVWKDQDVENPRTYVERDNGDGTITLLDAFGTVTELGTPVNAEKMNHIEDGIEEVDSTTVHKTGNETITGIKTFSVSPVVPTKAISDNSQAPATTSFAHSLLATLLTELYPVGSIYIGTQNTCPLASLISGSQWKLVAQDRALWGGNGSNGNTTIAAGLPNITGYFGGLRTEGGTTSSGAFYNGGNNMGAANGQGTNCSVNFDASRSSSIYGNSNTVQPPAYRVNVWRRTA